MNTRLAIYKRTGALTAQADFSVLTGNGDGSFLFAPPTSTSVGEASQFVADVNRDGRPDLVVSEFGGDVRVRLGNGDGTFRPATNQAYLLGDQYSDHVSGG